MTDTVAKTDFKRDAFKHFRDIRETGKVVIVTDHGRPVIEIRRYRTDDRSPQEILRGSVLRFDMPEEDVPA